MAKNIAVADDVYEILKRLKRENESFTDVIRRLVKKNSMLSDLAGRQTFTQEEWNTVKNVYQIQRELDKTRRNNLLEQVKQ